MALFAGGRRMVAYLLNRRLVRGAELIFPGMAQTRAAQIQSWVDGNWSMLAAVAEAVGDLVEPPPDRALSELAALMPEYAELALCTPEGGILASSAKGRRGKLWEQAVSLERGLKAPFLHGPYVDPVTEALGRTTSAHHDAVTLMFYQPVERGGETVACVCGRIPNDVLGDLIQREEGHVYPGSGDNYLFLVKAGFDTERRVGCALSRSRFEDDRLTPGVSLLKGTPTRYGTVRVQRHTELELVVNDPATGKLQPGAAATITNGKNLMVRYPGYPDYRHVPVVGAGLRFQVTGSPDVWGLMCEADLDEVYGQCSLALTLNSVQGLLMAVAMGVTYAAANVWVLQGGMLVAVLAVTWASALAVGHGLGVAPLRRCLDRLCGFFFRLSEGNGTLQHRVERYSGRRDEVGLLSRWINSFVGRMDQTVGAVADSSVRLDSAAGQLGTMAGELARSSAEQNRLSESSAAAVEQFTTTTRHIAEQGSETQSGSEEALRLAERGQGVMKNNRQAMEQVSAIVSRSVGSMRELEQRSKEITDILGLIEGVTQQTNLLALNAAIEAARAGDAGRGFSVVAEEVRALATRTQESAGRIGELIDAIHAALESASHEMGELEQSVDTANRVSEEAGQALEQIASGARHSLELVQGIATATEEQSAAGAQVSGHLGEIATMARNNQHSVEQCEAAAHRLQLLALALRRGSAAFSR
ncbi:MAG: methyl-accepting chemotaxis protein [Ectothiorhodospiraceae bacterium]|nr:methyl-accepting chemotaxis protein [Ectothiorhodospiraceae bacterium]